MDLSKLRRARESFQVRADAARKRVEALAAVPAEPAGDQIQCLDPVGALVYRCDADVANILLYTRIAYIPLSAEDLHGQVCDFESGVSPAGLADRQQPFGERSGSRARRSVGRGGGNIEVPGDFEQ